MLETLPRFETERHEKRKRWGKRKKKDRSRSKSREKEGEERKRGHERSSPYPRQIRRVASGEGTDRDSDTSEENERLNEAERGVRKAQENLEKEKKKIFKQRRIRTSTPRIFNDDELDLTLKELRFERGKEEESGARRKVRRLKKGSCSSSLGDDSLQIVGQPLVKGISKQKSSEKT